LDGKSYRTEIRGPVGIPGYPAGALLSRKDLKVRETIGQRLRPAVASGRSLGPYG